jgi:hypothetical protein
MPTFNASGPTFFLSEPLVPYRSFPMLAGRMDASTKATRTPLRRGSHLNAVNGGHARIESPGIVITRDHTRLPPNHETAAFVDPNVDGSWIRECKSLLACSRHRMVSSRHRLCREDALGTGHSAPSGRQRALCREPQQILSAHLCRKAYTALGRDF